MTMLTIMKELEKYNKASIMLGFDEKAVKLDLGLGVTETGIKTVKDLKKLIKKEIVPDFIDIYLNEELEKYRNEFTGKVNNNEISIVIY